MQLGKENSDLAELLKDSSNQHREIKARLEEHIAELTSALSEREHKSDTSSSVRELACVLPLTNSRG